MRSDAEPLVPSFNDGDRRLVAAAIETHAFERQALGQALTPLGFGARKREAAYATALRETESALRKAATLMDRWRVSFAPRVDVVHMRNAHELRGMLAPAAIRYSELKFDHVLLHIHGTVRTGGRIPLSLLNLILDLDPKVKTQRRRAVIHAMFPRSEGAFYRGIEVCVGLRSNLTFWVPRTPEGIPFTRAHDVGAPVRRLLLVGPLRAAFRRVIPTGTGAGTSRASWRIRVARNPLGAGNLDLWLVAKVPRGRKSIAITASLEAAVSMPRPLSGLLGRERIIWDQRNWRVEMADAVAQPPAASA